MSVVLAMSLSMADLFFSDLGGMAGGEETSLPPPPTEGNSEIKGNNHVRDGLECNLYGIEPGPPPSSSGMDPAGEAGSKKALSGTGEGGVSLEEAMEDAAATDSKVGRGLQGRRSA